jgi:tetratricopeptide (TPR) repeat protein
MKKPFHNLTISALLSWSVGLPSASAQQGMGDEALTQLGKDLEIARAAYEGGDFATARDALLRVYAIYPEPKVLYRLALCHERLGEDALAIKAYQDYLIKVPNDPERAKIEGIIRSLQERSAPRTAKLQLSTSPADALIWIDGSERLEQPEEDGSRRIALSAGEHTIRISRDGFASQERKIEISPDERYNMVIALQPLFDERSDALAWTLTGVGAATLVAGTFFLGRAAGADSVLGSLYEARTSERRPSRYDDAAEGYNSDVLWGWSLLGAGLLTTGVGLTMLWWGDDDAPVSATLVPSLDKDAHMGATLRIEY